MFNVSSFVANCTSFASSQATSYLPALSHLNSSSTLTDYQKILMTRTLIASSIAAIGSAFSLFKAAKDHNRAHLFTSIVVFSTFTSIATLQYLFLTTLGQTSINSEGQTVIE